MRPEETENGGPDAVAGTGERGPDWWHRDHPTFTALCGFFTGLVAVCLVPGLYLTVLDQMLDPSTVAEVFPLVLVLLAVPLALIAQPRTRRFGQYLLLGVVVTGVVVIGVSTLVLWVLLQTQR